MQKRRSDPQFGRGAGCPFAHGWRQQAAAAKKLVDVRNKLAETIQRVDELMGEGGPKA